MLMRLPIAVSIALASFAAMSACAPSAVEIEQRRERNYLAAIHITGFEETRSDYVKNATGYYIGPPSLDPLRDVRGQGLSLSVPPVFRGFDSLYETLAEGPGVAADGVSCYVFIRKPRPGSQQFELLTDLWHLSSEEAEIVVRGDRLAVKVDVVCGAR